MFLRIFDRYIGRQVYSGTLTGVIVLSGVMVLANVFKRLDQLLGDTELPIEQRNQMTAVTPDAHG